MCCVSDKCIVFQISWWRFHCVCCVLRKLCCITNVYVLCFQCVLCFALMAHRRRLTFRRRTPMSGDLATTFLAAFGKRSMDWKRIGSKKPQEPQINLL